MLAKIAVLIFFWIIISGCSLWSDVKDSASNMGSGVGPSYYDVTVH